MAVSVRQSDRFHGCVCVVEGTPVAETDTLLCSEFAEFVKVCGLWEIYPEEESAPRTGPCADVANMLIERLHHSTTFRTHSSIRLYKTRFVMLHKKFGNDRTRQGTRPAVPAVLMNLSVVGFPCYEITLSDPCA